MSRLGQAMGTQRARKRSDFYPTIDRRAIPALIAAMLAVGDISAGQAASYAEPCAGQGDLIQLLQQEAPQLQCAFGLEYDWQDEGLHNRWPIAHGNALTLIERDLAGVDLIITNPPWKREALHPLILHLASLRPTWLLYDGSWAFTKQAAPFKRILTDVAAVGRLRFFRAPAAPAARERCGLCRSRAQVAIAGPARRLRLVSFLRGRGERCPAPAASCSAGRARTQPTGAAGAGLVRRDRAPCEAPAAALAAAHGARQVGQLDARAAIP